MVRKIDELGRIVLPAEYRQALGIREKDSLELALEPDKITIRKPELGCHFCGAAVNLIHIGDEYVCKACIERLHEAKDGAVLYPIKVN
jgi:transcriptional pleiotropic regulator of transition state genes